MPTRRTVQQAGTFAKKSRWLAAASWTICRNSKTLPIHGASTRKKPRGRWHANDSRCDVDASAFLLGENGRVLSDEGFVFYGQQTSSDGSVRFQPSGADDRETITVDIARIDPQIRKIVFVLTIDEALTQKLHFGMLQNVYLRILDDRDGREILSYPLGNAFENVTSMTLGELYLHQGQWKFNPVGNGVHMDLAGQCALYGVTLA